MKNFEYKPQPQEVDGKEQPAKFEGSVVLKIPKYKERLKLIKSLQLEYDSQGQVVKSGSQFDAAEKIADMVPKYVEAVDLKHTATGEAYDSLESLEYSQEGTELINELGNVILSGIRLGNS